MCRALSMKDSISSLPSTAGETGIYPSASFWPEVSLAFRDNCVCRQPQLP